jgi:hypothetical protein
VSGELGKGFAVMITSIPCPTRWCMGVIPWGYFMGYRYRVAQVDKEIYLRSSFTTIAYIQIQDSLERIDCGEFRPRE